MSEISDILQAFALVGAKPKATGKNRWSVRCPAHDDKFHSGSIRQMPDGWVTLKCFAGCTRRQILHATGLTWEQLSPTGGEIEKRRKDEEPFYRPSESSGNFPTKDIWQLGKDELLVAYLILSDITKGPLPPETVARIPFCRDVLAAMLRELG